MCMWKYGCEELCACGSKAVRSYVHVEVWL